METNYPEHGNYTPLHLLEQKEDVYIENLDMGELRIIDKFLNHKKLNENEIQCLLHTDLRNKLPEKYKKYLNIIIRDFTVGFEDKFESACEEGNFEVATWMLEKYPQKELLFCRSCQRGLSHTAKWLMTEEKVNISPYYKYCILEACRNGLLEIVKLLASKRENLLTKDIFHMACVNGRIKVAEWLSDKIPRIPYWRVFRPTCENGHAEMVKWLLEKGEEKVYVDQNDFNSVCKNGHLEVVKLLLNQVDIDEKVFEITCKYNRQEVLLYIVENAENLDVDYVKVIRMVCEKGYFSIAKLLFEKGIENLSLTDVRYIFRLACEKGHLGTVKFLLEKYSKIYIPANKDQVYRLACKGKHFEVAKHLVDKHPKISCENNYIFNWTCDNGYFEMVKYLFGKNPEICSTYENGFCQACKYGDLKTAQWFVEQEIKIDISADNERAFRSACENGHLQVAEWLLEEKPDIDISADEEYAFRKACSNGNMKLIKWLLETNPEIDIYACDNEAFNSAYKKKHFALSKFLFEKDRTKINLQEYRLGVNIAHGLDNCFHPGIVPQQLHRDL